MRQIHKSVWLVAVVMLGLMLISGCAGKSKSMEPAEKPSYWFDDTVDVGFVKQYTQYPYPENVTIIDSRPYRAKYVKGYIPGAVSISDSEFDKKTDMLPADKRQLLIFYCGGLECPLSHKSAHKAVKMGYTNVKVLPTGFPSWKKKGSYPAIMAEGVKEIITEGKKPYLLIDSRPHNKFLEGHIPSAINIPDRKLDEMAGVLPADKSTQLIFYCGGYACALSHKSALQAKEMGYTNVWVMEEGYPGWKKKFGGAEAMAVKAGGEEGSIDLEQFKKILAENPESINLIDVRDPEEFAKGALPGATNMTVDQVEENIESLKDDPPLVFVCSTGARSGEAYYMLLDMRPDLKKVYYVEAEVKINDDGSYAFTKP